MLKSILTSISKQEQRWLYLIALVLVIITTLPYIYLWHETPASYHYAFTSHVNAADNFVYYSYINQAKAGAWLFDDLFTTESTARSLHPFWLLAGKTAQVFDWSAEFTFHFFRILFVCLAVYFFYLVISHFLTKPKERLTALGLLLFTVGQGWIYALVKPFFWLSSHWSAVPFDTFSPESFFFFSAYVSPHFILSWLLLIGALWFGYLSLSQQYWIYALWSGILNGFLIFLHPFYIVTLPIILGVFWFYKCWQQYSIQWRGLVNLMLIGLFTLPAGIYYLYFFQTDWTLTIRTIQNLLPSPPWFLTILSFGLFFLLAVAGALVWYRADNKPHRDKIFFIISWSVLGCFLIYLPVYWQRRLVEGWQFPLVILSAIFLDWFFNKLEVNFKSYYIKNFLMAGFWFILSLGSLNILFSSFDIKNNQPELFYYPIELDNLAAWLKNNTQITDKLITNGPVFFYLPGLVNRKIYFGHLTETVYSHAKFNEIKWLFTNDNQAQAKYDWLRFNDLEYLVFNQAGGDFSNFQPAGKTYLTKVFGQGNFTVYKIEK